MSKGKGKGGTPKVFAVYGTDGAIRSVIARSAKAARQISEREGFPVSKSLNGQAVTLTKTSPVDAKGAINFNRPRE